MIEVGVAFILYFKIKNNVKTTAIIEMLRSLIFLAQIQRFPKSDRVWKTDPDERTASTTTTLFVSSYVDVCQSRCADVCVCVCVAEATHVILCLTVRGFGVLAL